MSIPQLTDDQIRDWTLEQKDRWWLENVYRGNTPQLTFRAAATGFLLGGVLSSTNLYIGAKTGWTLGVGITSVILTFAMFRLMAKFGWARDISILENNCSQSVATAAGYMTGPLISALAAYMIIDNRLLPWHQIMFWNIVTSILGVLFAFPLKRWFINDEQHPFPEGRAAGVVLATLHQGEEGSAMRHARVMMGAGALAALFKFFQAEGIQTWIQFQLLGLSERLKGHVVRIPESLDVVLEWFQLKAPRIAGVDVRQLTLVPTLELSLFGAGGLMGIRAGVSLLIGAVLNYAILAPWMISLEQITPAVAADGTAVFGMKRISLWALWPGVACLVAASMTAFLIQPKMLWQAMTGLFRRRNQSRVLEHVELPLWISAVGIPLVGLVAALLARAYFGVDVLMCVIGLPLAFALTVVSANSTALTSITPVSASAKITQLFYGMVQPGNIHTNVATAGLTTEVVSNASNLLMDLKPGYMLGAKPRLQAIAHVIGIFSGALFSVPLFYVLFTQKVEVADGVTTNIESIQSEKFPMPSVTVWRAVAEVLTEGIGSLSESVRWAVLVGALVGIALEVARVTTRGRFPLSPVALGLAFVIDFGSSFAMFAGAFFFWCMGVGRVKPEQAKDNWWVEHHDPICAGLIAGAAILGVIDAMVTAFLI